MKKNLLLLCCLFISLYGNTQSVNEGMTPCFQWYLNESTKALEGYKKYINEFATDAFSGNNPYNLKNQKLREDAYEKYQKRKAFLNKELQKCEEVYENNNSSKQRSSGSQSAGSTIGSAYASTIQEAANAETVDDMYRSAERKESDYRLYAYQERTEIAKNIAGQTDTSNKIVYRPQKKESIDKTERINNFNWKEECQCQQNILNIPSLKNDDISQDLEYGDLKLGDNNAIETNIGSKASKNNLLLQGDNFFLATNASISFKTGTSASIGGSVGISLTVYDIGIDIIGNKLEIVRSKDAFELNLTGTINEDLFINKNGGSINFNKERGEVNIGDNFTFGVNNNRRGMTLEIMGFGGGFEITDNSGKAELSVKKVKASIEIDENSWNVALSAKSKFLKGKAGYNHSIESITNYCYDGLTTAQVKNIIDSYIVAEKNRDYANPYVYDALKLVNNHNTYDELKRINNERVQTIENIATTVDNIKDILYIVSPYSELDFSNSKKNVLQEKEKYRELLYGTYNDAYNIDEYNRYKYTRVALGTEEYKKLLQEEMQNCFNDRDYERLNKTKEKLDELACDLDSESLYWNTLSKYVEVSELIEQNYFNNPTPKSRFHDKYEYR